VDKYGEGRPDGFGVTVGQFLDRWLDGCERMDLSPTTIRNYTGAGESSDYWLGEDSRLLGLEGEVAPGDLRSILAGVSSQCEILTAGGVAPGEPGRLRPHLLGPEIGFRNDGNANRQVLACD
jgi:hypothetical protein